MTCLNARLRSRTAALSLCHVSTEHSRTHCSTVSGHILQQLHQNKYIYTGGGDTEKHPRRALTHYEEEHIIIQSTQSSPGIFLCLVTQVSTVHYCALFLSSVRVSLILSSPRSWFLHVIGIKSAPTHSTGRDKPTLVDRPGEDHSYFISSWFEYCSF